jgi:glyceraldehyde-3-phosphate dehydrogenase/erythrose-4-phosphate dehydrogenase
MINVALLGFGRIGQMHAQNIYLNKTLNLLYVYEKIDKLRKHDLAKLSLKKPGLVEKKINNGTKKLFRSLESLTGAMPPAPVVE